MNFGPDTATATNPSGGLVTPGQLVTTAATTGTTSSTGTHSTTDGVDAIESAASAANFPVTYALWIDEGMRFSPSQMISNIPKLAAAYIADPAQTPGQLAV